MMTGILAWLATYLIHSTLLLAATFLLTRRVVRNDNWRDTLWKTAIIGGLITASVQVWIGYRPLGGQLHLDPGAARGAVQHLASGPGTPEQPTDPAFVVPPAERTPTTSGPSSPALRPAPVERDIPWLPLLLAAWALGAFALLARLVHRQRRLNAALADRQDLGGPTRTMLEELRTRAGWHRPVRLTSSDWCPTPIAMGWNEVCVPTRLTTRPVPEQRGALAHELAHVVRADPAWQLTAAILEAVLFFQPLNGVARRGLRHAAENLADDWAVRHTGAPVELARCLVEVATWVGLRTETLPSGAAAMAEHDSALGHRVERLLAWRPRPIPATTWRVAIMVGAFMVLAGAAPAVSRSPTGFPLPDALETGTMPDSVIAHPDTTQPFEARWTWALARSAGRAAWVAWSVPSVVARGSWWLADSDPWSGRILRGGGPIEAAADQAIMLVALDTDGTPTRLAGRSADLAFPEPDRPVFWLGSVDAETSVRFLRARFERAASTRWHRTVIDMVSVHRAASVAPLLREVLATEEPDDVREQAAEGLALHGSAETVAALQSAALSDRARSVSEQAAEALGGIRRLDARDALITIADTDRDADVEQQAVEALGHFTDDVTRAALERIARRHPDGRVRREALEVLGVQEMVSDSFLLRFALSEDRDGELAREAVEAFEAIDPTAAAPMLMRIAFEAASTDAQEQAAESLGRLPARLAVPLLGEVINRHRDESVIQQAVEALGRSRHPDVQSMLESIVRNHWSRDARREALDYLN